ncbi:hypothetical protein PROFUN_06802 [Planoprotostelium fungivorum]|uniref:Secreted protein n=1 Tax=Planoprotostelium fungivorum TaxID=1890364 RepID=A0A2P6NNN4_9EUKA|nr:hypothetical protein PROFUN_06802 [Planoprotostelium fungivorum]
MSLQCLLCFGICAYSVCGVCSVCLQHEAKLFCCQFYFYCLYQTIEKKQEYTNLNLTFHNAKFYQN